MPSQRYRLGRTALIATTISWFFAVPAITILLSALAFYLIVTSDELR